MAEKPRHMLWSVPDPAARDAYIRDLNRVNRKHGLLGTSSLTSNTFQAWSPAVLDDTLTGALVRANAKEGAIARTEALGPRNVDLAKTYSKRLKAARAAGNPIGESELKAQIGSSEGLGRSAAIEAVNDGLRRLNQK